MALDFDARGGKLICLKLLQYFKSSKFFQLQQDIQMKNNEAQREARKKDKLERELRQTKTDLDAKLGEIRDLQQKIEQYTAEKSKLENEKLVIRVIKKISVTFEPMCPLSKNLCNSL